MDHGNSAAATALAGIFTGGFLLVWLAFIVLALIVNWRIASKAGYSGALSLLMLVPLLNFVVLLIFAFRRWPIEEQLATTRGYDGVARP